LLKIKEEELEEIDNNNQEDKEEVVEEEEDKDQDKKTPLNKLQNNKLNKLQLHERRMFFIQIILNTSYFYFCFSLAIQLFAVKVKVKILNKYTINWNINNSHIK
jgi:hypothetical protein